LLRTGEDTIVNGFNFLGFLGKAARVRIDRLLRRFDVRFLERRLDLDFIFIYRNVKEYLFYSKER